MDRNMMVVGSFAAWSYLRKLDGLSLSNGVNAAYVYFILAEAGMA